VESSPRTLATDYIGLYQVRWPDPATPFVETAEALAKLIADCKIRHVGVSNFDVAPDGGLQRHPAGRNLQPLYHRSRRAVEAEVPTAARHLRPCLLARGPRVAGRAPQTRHPARSQGTSGP
jgi:aryl-alcohol dehydrogenase-like predicted oxidoreductase